MRRKRKKVPLCLRIREDHYQALVSKCEKLTEEGAEVSVQELLRRAAAKLAQPSKSAEKTKGDDMNDDRNKWWRDN